MAGGDLFFGDSVGWQLAGTADVFGYADQLEAGGLGIPPGLGSLGYDVINCAVPGSGCALEALNDIETITGTTYEALLLTHNPDRVVLHFGGNNWPWSDASQQVLEAWGTLRWVLLSIAGYKRIIDAAVAAVGAANVIVVGGLRAWWYGDPNNFWADGIGAWGRYVLDVLLPTDYPAITNLVDCADLEPNGPYRYEDTIHLNDAGALLVAQRIAALIPVAPPLPPAPPVEPAPPPPQTTPVVTPAYRRAMHDSHVEQVCRVDVHRRDTRDPIAQLAVLSGTLTIDDADETHRSANATVVDPSGELTPELATDVLSPFTCELAVWAGIRHFPTRQEELTQQALLKVTDLDVDDEGGLTYSLTMFDRSVRAQLPLGKAVVTPPGTPVEVAARDLLWHATPTVPVNFPTTGYVTPLLIHPENASAWDEAAQLFLMSGYKLECSRDGAYTAAPVAVTAAPVATWEFVEGTRANYWQPHRVLSGDELYNHVIVRSSNTGAGGVQGEAMDLDPASPTYVNGPYGHLTKIFSDPRVTTEAQATAAAGAILARQLGPGESIPYKGRPNYALDTGETVRVKRERLGIDTLALVQHLELPLGLGEMSATTRRSVVTDRSAVGAAL